MGEFYVYIHLRADSGLPFYIGKGKGKRAWNRRHRSKHWKRVAAKHGVIIELLHVGLTEEEAFAKEIEEISWARRYFDIVNVSDGGDGGEMSVKTSPRKDAILCFVETHKRIPSPRAEEETHLYSSFLNYTSPSSTAYDAEFAQKIKPYGFRAKSGDRQAQQKAEIILFCQTEGRPPSRESEPILWGRWNAFCSPSSNRYDQEFRDKMQTLGLRHPAGETRKDEVLSFMREHGRTPRRRVPEESSLAVCFMNYTCETQVAYDPEFVDEAKKYGYRPRGAYANRGSGKTKP